jgi:hypothetical protein
MLSGVAGVMIEHLERRGDLFAHNVPDLRRRRSAMQARGDQNADAVFRNSSGLQALEQRRQNHRVRSGPRDIAHGNRGRKLSSG